LSGKQKSAFDYYSETGFNRKPVSLNRMRPMYVCVCVV